MRCDYTYYICDKPSVIKHCSALQAYEEKDQWERKENLEVNPGAYVNLYDKGGNSKHW